MQAEDMASRDAQKLKVLTMITYGLCIMSIIYPKTLIPAIMINYIKKADLKGTIYETHSRWQIRTVWFGLLILCAALVAGSYSSQIGGICIFFCILYCVYRFVKGFLMLYDNKPIQSS